MTTALPVQIRSALKDSKHITVCELDIDIHKNEPRGRIPNPTTGNQLQISHKPDANLPLALTQQPR